MPRALGAIATTVLVILFVGAAALAVVAIARPVVEEQRGTAAAPGTAPSGDQAQVLVERLLAQPFMGPDGSFQAQGARLVPGALPSDIALDVPVPAGVRLVGSVVRSRGGKPASVDVVLDVPGSPSDAQTLYEKEFAARGWTVPQNRGYTPGGFAPAGGPMLSRMYCKGTSAPWISTTFYPVAAGPADLRVHVELTAPTQPNAYTPCDTSKLPGGPPPSYNQKLPPLRAPDGVSLRPSGGGGGSDRQESTAFAKTSKRAAELETAFADQLSAAGWTRSERGAQGSVAWSTWKIPGEGDWTGVLLVRETGSDTRSLLLVAESLGAGGSGYYVGGGAVFTKP